MSDTAEMIHEDALPGEERKLDPKPEWQPRYSGSGRLDGKVALITGADSGIGRAVAALFAREGADIAILYLLEDADDWVERSGSPGPAFEPRPSAALRRLILCKLVLFNNSPYARVLLINGLISTACKYFLKTVRAHFYAPLDRCKRKSARRSAN